MDKQPETETAASDVEMPPEEMPKVAIFDESKFDDGSAFDVQPAPEVLTWGRSKWGDGSVWGGSKPATDEKGGR